MLRIYSKKKKGILNNFKRNKNRMNSSDIILSCKWPWNRWHAAKSLQSCPTLCDPIDGSPAGSPVPGILQARTLEWVAISFSNAWKWKVKVKSLSHVRLSDPMDCSLPGSSIHGIFQARVLEWGAIAFSGLLSSILQIEGNSVSSHPEYSLDSFSA